ncbi:MAG: heavy metal-associated domain-containing protein [Methanocorpusculum sp.]|uniref:heavy metal-associated domain-containing protein n=1 Tax=Methanocorpusculum sp. TaxID=2058474 RepID=UPI002A3C26ED|nr:heavy metal-associated domain-containing protein [Methanocorpusculum sp.]MDD2248123.1 heavy metal-associated domain-containing protein [Methanocorpusculum sp.]MDD2803646.1 heavy metal-associated domain-containing protein [Methanocorpusculum sp.]MDD3047354.1 heavy metal-associated domain-containing protein [Methanocorpusculum sp.]MDD3911929.1 heavy metal-associated domain-containing protein [Methanocorpusculum sp.]MDY3201738.1 heavy metal-associated domain-containing protein [Methanocorpuscu
MKKSFRLENLDCAHCAAVMENGIRKIEGVHEASISFMTRRLVLDADDERFPDILNEAKVICRRVEPDCFIEE